MEIEKSVDRQGCTGACCENFFMPFSLDKFKERAAEGKKINGSVEEAGLLVAMLVPIGKDKEGWRYNCRHFDPVLRYCMDYKRRPVVCRIYPSVPCAKEGCTRKPIEKEIKNV